MTDTKTPEELVAGLIRLLTVTDKGDGRFAGRQQPGGIGRVFGGQVVAQALQAAQASAPDGMEAHSLHAYFLRGGREGIDIDYSVAADFDGRSFANRRVVARQQVGDDEPSAILNLTASFQRPEEGLEHANSVMPDVAPPEELLPDSELRKRFLDAMENVSDVQRSLMLRPRPIEMRTSDKLHWMNAEPKPPAAHSWFRTVAPLPAIKDNSALHRAVIAYASDFTLLGTSALPHGLSWARGELKGASLDHAIWFHRPARADEWLLYATDSPWSGGGRGFNRGRIFNRDGQLVASVAQEGVIRRAKGKDET
ncbi:acyl-CoA thioesterase II [Erythrobacter aquimaris]|uniref:Acyl-CoA thioesterase II n=1 Tax=Qipengyuania aquimaris TaxID=255984 RepID=A0A6I4TH89_9SPHN|nr:acyl-CoA thioesterase domain-containing protein [Qipengyuania aquimaris]MXO95156.1 acyl-CoA thioesterase II [Qipengyuania aquimaris]